MLCIIIASLAWMILASSPVPGSLRSVTSKHRGVDVCAKAYRAPPMQRIHSGCVPVRSRERTSTARSCAVPLCYCAIFLCRNFDVCKTTPLYKFEMKVSKRTADWIISLVSDKIRCCGCDRDPDIIYNRIWRVNKSSSRRNPHPVYTTILM